MSRIIIGVMFAVAAVLVAPAPLHAQVPVVLVCQDGSTQPGPAKVGCKDHRGVDWNTTNTWTKMRAGRYAVTDTVVCTDGQAAAAGAKACASNGGVDSVSTVAAVRRRAKAGRYVPSPQTAQKGADTTKADSTKWGYRTDRQPGVQNPPGYRGMERPVNVFPADSAAKADSQASGTATSRINQMRRQGSADAKPHQNPPGYRGMERPAGLDSVQAKPDSTQAEPGDTSSGKQR